ncbi:hypothetical protein BsWGS_22027 [Bradybaena similaris]
MSNVSAVLNQDGQNRTARMSSQADMSKRTSRLTAVEVASKRSRFSDSFSAVTEHEDHRLLEHLNDPLFWGPYLSDRQWGTVREDYSISGACWDYLTYSQATKQAYHWGEDGLLGISDKFGILCASLALWNKKDPILKERLFGLTGTEGNHGEDVKELYYYLDNTPKHTYMKAMYRYPQAEFPYEALINHGRTPAEPELEIMDTGVFDGHDYWDVSVEYAKPVTRTMMCRITVFNHSSHHATLDVLPQFCFRNTWSKMGPGRSEHVPLFQKSDVDSIDAICDLGMFRIKFHHSSNVTLNSLLFTNNDSVREEFEESEEGGDVTKSFANSRKSTLLLEPCKKDGFHQFVVNGVSDAISLTPVGTKCCAWMTVELDGNTKTTIYWQITPAHDPCEPTTDKIDAIFSAQMAKANDFYQKNIPKTCSKEEFTICRQALAGLLWSKQLYIYNMDLKNKELMKLYDESYFKTPFGKKKLGWNHLSCYDILIMPDKWEFPWFAAWDLAFHSVQYARIDVPLAKEQILLLMSDRYMHPNGQIPGCEFDLGDPNPPIICWAVWKIYKQEGIRDLAFLKTCFNRLIFCFQWWHKKDPKSLYVYGNGFMGLDNISVFDRSSLPSGVTSLKQADCTGWMGLFALNMFQIAIELCRFDSSYTDMAVKFLKHFLNIARAINRPVNEGGLWDDQDRFFYDVIHYHGPYVTPIRLRSWTGIIPLFGCCTVDLKHSPLVKAFLLKCDRGYSPFVCKLGDNEFFLTLVSYTKLKLVLKTIFSEEEFLSPFGVRSLSKVYKDKPFSFDVGETSLKVTYLPGVSDSNIFGGNSNWRGPIWLCMNYLFVECLERYSELDRVFTLPLSIHYPTGTQIKSTFVTIVHDLCKRIISIFLPDQMGARPVHGAHKKYSNDSDWEQLVLFYEYFNAETGEGCGASHQTGWSALVYEFIHKLHTFPRPERAQI